MSQLEIHQFTCRSDNFGLLMHDPVTEFTACIDTPDGETIWHELTNKNWSLTHILNTHHHYDHVPGNEMLAERTGCAIVGSKKDAHRIPHISEELEEGDTIEFGAHTIRMLETPGHTLGSVCYYVEPDKILFTGDTLFSLGCGRLFEGDPALMWQSMQKILSFPDETEIYCGHEYTLANAAFALVIEPGNEALQARAKEVEELRRTGQATLPVSLATERATNPFLRPDQLEIQQYFDLEGQSHLEVFAATRALRNEF